MASPISNEMLLGWSLGNKAVEASEIWGIEINGFAMSPFGLPALPILPLGTPDGANRIPKGTKVAIAAHPVFWLPASVRVRKNESMAKYNLRLNLELFYRGYLNISNFLVANIFEDAFGPNIASSEKFTHRVARYIDGATDDLELNRLVTKDGGLFNKNGKRNLENELNSLYMLLDGEWSRFCADYDDMERNRIILAADRAKTIIAKDVVAPFAPYVKSILDKNDRSNEALEDYRSKVINYLALIDKFIEDALLLERSTIKEDYIDDLQYYQLTYESERNQAFSLIDRQAMLWFDKGDPSGMNKIAETILLFLHKYQVRSLSALSEGIRPIGSYNRWTKQLENRSWLQSQREIVGSAL